MSRGLACAGSRPTAGRDIPTPARSRYSRPRLSRTRSDQDCAELFSVTFFFLGRELPWVPRQILPRLVRRSPLPIPVPPDIRSGFITPSDSRWRCCRPLEMLTYCRVCCAFESACALPSGVIRGFETTSMYWPCFLAEGFLYHRRHPEFNRPQRRRTDSPAGRSEPTGPRFALRRPSTPLAN
jgi:hypothetical protein